MDYTRDTGLSNLNEKFNSYIAAISPQQSPQKKNKDKQFQLTETLIDKSPENQREGTQADEKLTSKRLSYIGTTGFENQRAAQDNFSEDQGNLQQRGRQMAR